MGFVVQSILLVMAFGYAVQAQNVTEGVDFELIMVKLSNLEQMIGQLQTDIRRQEGSLNGLTSMVQQVQTEIRQQEETLYSHSMLLNIIRDLSINNAQQLQIEMRKQAEMSEYYYHNLLNLLNNGGGSCVDQNVTQPDNCQLQIGDEIIDLLCEENQHGKGWIVIQSRFNGSVIFYRYWNEYRNGFGSVAGEYWLGLENVHLLTSSKDYELLVHLETFDGYTGFARYSKFRIGSESEGYQLQSLGSFSGTAGDSLSYHQGQKFSTFDRDNDSSQAFNCAVEFHGGWWYRDCGISTLNARWDNGTPYLMYWGSFPSPLKISKMMIRKV